MRSKALTVLLGAIVASSFSAPVKFGAGGSADAADAVPTRRPEAIKVPEFVPVINFSEFVMAMQTFAAQNPPAARIAAEELSAKFASNGDAQKIELHKPTQQAAATPETQQPAIVTRPVVTASISEAPATPALPAVPDPAGSPSAVADPVKVITGYPIKRAEAAPQHHKSERKVAAVTSGSRSEKRFQPAMGLGMPIDSAEDVPPMSALAQKKSKVNATSRGLE